jgi:hypothetical protein
MTANTTGWKERRRGDTGHGDTANVSPDCCQLATFCLAQIVSPSRNLPRPATLPAYRDFSRWLHFHHMKKSHTKSGVSREGQGNGAGIVELLKSIESHVDRGRKIGWIIYKKLESIDESIGIFAAQKKRELTPEKPDSTESA